MKTNWNERNSNCAPLAQNTHELTIVVYCVACVYAIFTMKVLTIVCTMIVGCKPLLYRCVFNYITKSNVYVWKHTIEYKVYMRYAYIQKQKQEDSIEVCVCIHEMFIFCEWLAECHSFREWSSVNLRLPALQGKTWSVSKNTLAIIGGNKFFDVSGVRISIQVDF